jgi:hypothetical protein
MEVGVKIETVTVHVENKIGGLRGDGHFETVYKFLVVLDAKNAPILVLPREGDMFD